MYHDKSKTTTGIGASVMENENKPFKEVLVSLRRSNLNRIILAHLNINSIPNKFSLLAEGVSGNVDITISETKIDETFPARQFYIDGYTPPYRLDRNFNGGGLIFVREDIPPKLIENSNSIEGIFLEINLRKKKWLLCGSYNPHKNLISQHLSVISKSLDTLLTKYDNVFLMGDFNADKNNTSLEDFCQLYNLKHLIKVPTCYKNPENPSIIDLMLTNSPYSYQNSCAIETGLSGFHKMTVTVLKTFFQKKGPKVISYRDYKNYSNDIFRQLINDDFNVLHQTSN